MLTNDELSLSSSQVILIIGEGFLFWERPKVSCKANSEVGVLKPQAVYT